LSHIDLDCIIFGLQRFGGISSYWAKLVAHVSSVPELRCRLVLPRHVTYQDFDEFPIRRVTVSREHLSARVSRYLRGRVSEGDGIFHTSYYRLPRGRVGRYVVSAYDFTYERYRTGLARAVHSTQKLASIRRADAVLCISESTRRDIIDFCPGIDTARLHVVHLAVDRKAFFPETGTLPMVGNSVLFVGQRGGYKRFDLAVEAIRRSPDLCLGIAGPQLSTVERGKLQRELGNRWVEHGSVSTHDLRRLYSSAFAFIFPSDYEGFGLPILEAMACGCPVIAAARSSLPEVGGSAALYAERQIAEDYASALDTLRTAERRVEAVYAGLQRVEAFSWAQTMDRTVTIYNQR
jgi:mannosyltransferase